MKTQKVGYRPDQSTWSWDYGVVGHGNSIHEAGENPIRSTIVEAYLFWLIQWVKVIAMALSFRQQGKAHDFGRLSCGEPSPGP